MRKPAFTIDRPKAVKRLEAVRLALGMTKGAFSETLAMYPPNYSRLIKGDFFLTADQLYTLWRRHRIDPAFIMDGFVGSMPVDLVKQIEEIQKDGLGDDS